MLALQKQSILFANGDGEPEAPDAQELTPGISAQPRANFTFHSDIPLMWKLMGSPARLGSAHRHCGEALLTEREGRVSGGENERGKYRVVKDKDRERESKDISNTVPQTCRALLSGYFFIPPF